MPTRPPKPIKLYWETETHARVLALIHSEGRTPLLTLPTEDGEPKECVAWRRDLEQKAVAMGGDITALCSLIRFSPRYLSCPWTMAVIEALRATRRNAKTARELEDAKNALGLLAEALRGGDLRGKHAHPGARHVSMLYRLLLPLYEAAQKGVSLQQLVPYSTVQEIREATKKGDVPPGYINVYAAARHDRDYIELPPAFSRYLDGRAKLPDGIEKHEAPFRLRSGGKPVKLPYCYRFAVPKDDLDWLKKPEGRRGRSLPEKAVSDFVLWRVACILNIAGASEKAISTDLDWLRRLVRKGKAD